MSDLLFQNFSTVQSNQQPQPVTIASATTIAPSTLITYLTGTAQVADITPPVTGQHMLVLIFTDQTPGTMLTTGNIATAVVPDQNTPTLMFYDPTTETYIGGITKLT